MRKTLIFTSVLALLLASCGTELVTEEALLKEKPKVNLSQVDFKVKVTPVDGKSLRSTFKVTSSDLQSLIGRNTLSRTSQSIPVIRKIEPVVYKRDTIMYIASYDKGWKAFSADKRMPIVLAENLEQTDMTAAKLLNNKNITSWLDMIITETKYLATTDEYEENSESLAQWAVNRSGIKRVPYQPVPGEYVYMGRENIATYTFTYPHILKTLWHRESPFNVYAPLLNANTLEQYKLSCTAVATGQYMYYLQDKKGYSFSMPSYVTASGTPSNYNFTMGPMVSMNLNDFALTDNWMIYTQEQQNKVATLISYISKELSVEYKQDSLSLSTYLKVQEFLNRIGVNGSFVDANFYNILWMIRAGEPALYRAEQKNPNHSGHMWLIDGCKYDSIVYDEVWRFFEDTIYIDPNNPREGVELRERYYDRKNFMYQMNWGEDINKMPGASDADDTYYIMGPFSIYNGRSYYFKREH